MKKWVTLITFNTSAEANLVKTKLESEGIQPFLKNEYTAQMLRHTTEPGGPIKMQVHRNDLDIAIKILKDGGFLSDKDTTPRQSALIEGIGLLTAKIPGLRNKPLQLRVILAVAVLLVVLTVVVALLTLPSSV